MTDATLYDTLVQKYGKVLTLTGDDSTGTPQVMYLRKPSYETKKAVMKLQMSGKDQLIEAGELILLQCYIGGFNFYEDEDVRLEAVTQVLEMIEMNDTFQLKKN